MQKDTQVQTSDVFYLSSDHNLFDVVSKGKYVYAYFSKRYDADWVSVGVNKFVKKYVREKGLDLSDRLAAGLEKENSTGASLSFYNNLELADVNYLLRPDVQEFTQAVAETNGIYDWRWGDAIIRYWQVALFSKPEEVFCLSPMLGVKYWHQDSNNIFDSRSCHLEAFQGASQLR